MIEDHPERHKVTCNVCGDETRVTDAQLIGGVHVCSDECGDVFVADLIEAKR